MVFASFVFLFFFLPLVVLGYYLLPSIRAKNLLLLLASFVFYAWGEPVWIVQMLLSGCLVYLSGLKLASIRRDARRYRKPRQIVQRELKRTLAIGITLALIPLIIFKYLNFFLDNLGLLFNSAWTIPGLTLPIGISFYTFQLITYLVDVYRQVTPVQRSLADFLLYESFFPQLIAGPIVRYHDIARQITQRVHSLDRALFGLRRFIIGLAKKVLIANYAGKLVAGTLDLKELTTLSGLEIILGTVAFAIQIYFDFSAYSDMAIGLGQIFGFKLLENFKAPYRSASITEFWRRWHISLGSFFRDYVYIPLGGNRRFQYRNLAIVWFLTGLWHGASWNFIFWGLYFLLFLLIEKAGWLRVLERLPRCIGRLYTLPVVLGGWLLFKFTELEQLRIVLRQLFTAEFSNLSAAVSLRQYGPFLILALILSQFSWPEVEAYFASRFRSRLDFVASPTYIFGYLILPLILSLLSVAALAADSFNPFLYFRF
ncbi:MAG: MBOAT family O-acyltransferase [Eubacteriales bacterium]|nr:MBOAT family O-acyltransferase [Eubacteriales bacterium]